MISEYKNPESRIFRDLHPISGAKESLNLMLQMDWNVFLVSSPTTSNTYSYKDKCEWVKKHLGDDWAKRLILTKDKTMIRGNVLIDDKISVTGFYKPSWTHIIFLSSYNKEEVLDNTKYDYVLYNWNSDVWIPMIKKILYNEN